MAAATTLDVGEAREVLAHWGLGVRSRQLVPGSGTANASVIVELPQERLLLRRRNPRYARPDWVCFDHALFAHLRSRGLPAPEPVPGPAGRGWLQRGNAIYELFRYVEGQQHIPGNVRELADAGRLLARIHLATTDFTPPAPKPWPRFHDPMLPREGLRDLLAQVRAHGEQEDRVALLRRAEELADALAERLPDDAYWSLPQAVVHGDYHPANLKFREGRVVGLFDWDWASRQPRMVDVADGLLFFCGVREEPVRAGDIWSLTAGFRLERERVRVFGSAYAQELTPTSEELCALADLMRCRWLYCRIDAAQRKVEPECRVEFFTRDLELPLSGIDALEPEIVGGELFTP